jgi:hypothetical protein
VLCSIGTLGKDLPVDVLLARSLQVDVLSAGRTLGRGTLRLYPLERVSTHPFRVLGGVACGNTKGECSSC